MIIQNNYPRTLHKIRPFLLPASLFFFAIAPIYAASTTFADTNGLERWQIVMSTRDAMTIVTAGSTGQTFFSFDGIGTPGDGFQEFGYITSFFDATPRALIGGNSPSGTPAITADLSSLIATLAVNTEMGGNRAYIASSAPTAGGSPTLAPSRVRISSLARASFC
jgi:hypothetical protein